MPDKQPRLRPHETQWGHSNGLTMSELREVGARMYHPLNPDQQRHAGQLSFTDSVSLDVYADPRDLAENGDF